MTEKARPRGPHRDASIRHFAEAVQSSKARAALLHAQSAQSAGSGPPLLRDALEELRIQQEELAVADEELRIQLDELAGSTARVRLERDHYHELFELAPDGYFVTDPLAIIRDVNSAGATMLGIEPRFLIGKPLCAFVDAADVRTVRTAIDAVRTERVREIEVRLKPRQAEPCWHALKAARVEGGAAVLWIARAIHDRWSVATAATPVETSEAPMGQRLAELTRANRDKDELLARERHLRTQLEQARAATNRFLSVVSQDLRAPLNAVLGWTQLLRREKLDHTARDRALATIERNARAQQRLVEEMLDLSAIAADQAHIERVPVDLAELARRATAVFALEASEHGVELAVAEPAEHVVVSGDRRWLEHAISNLLSNALRFTGAGGRITLRVEHAAARARLVVEDTGRGIAPELLPHVFDGFRQTRDDTTAVEGRGLGLFIVRRAVEMHEGTVVAESEGLNRGARFIVELPLIVLSTQTARDLPAEARAREPEGLEGVRVLVVDDDEDARELMAAVLRQRGARVTGVADVAAALSASSSSDPDVIVIELGMPGRAAHELLGQLRARPVSASPPPALVAISGYATSHEVDQALEAGFDLHLAKPFEARTLTSVIADAARSRR